MFCLATLQPHHAQGPTRFLTRDEMVRQIGAFYAMKQHIPLCIDHCGAQTCGFVVPTQERIGRVVDLWVGPAGHLMCKLALDGKHHAFKRINRGIFHSGESWGVSVWLDQVLDLKALTHVALTTNPYFAARGTWLHGWNLYEGPLNRQIARQYYDATSAHCYADAALLDKLNGVWHSDSPASTHFAASARTETNEMDVEQPNGAPAQQATQTAPQAFSQPQPAVEREALKTRQEQQDEAEGAEPEQNKRARLADGAQGEQRARQTTGVLPMEADIDMDNPASVKRAIRAYEEFMDDSGVGMRALDSGAKLTYAKIVQHGDSQDQAFTKQYHKMFTDQGLKAPDLSFVPKEAQEHVFSFVAASGSYTKRNEEELERLRKQVASFEQEQVHSFSIKSTARNQPQTLFAQMSPQQSLALPPQQSLALPPQQPVAKAIAASEPVRTRPLRSSYFDQVFCDQGAPQKQGSADAATLAASQPGFSDFEQLFRAKTAGM